jgi:hypothetical protein
MVDTHNKGVSAPSGPCFEKHYSVRELSELWGFSADIVRHMLEDEDGVVRFGHGEELHRRRYISLRIPASVAERIHRKLTTTGVGTKLVGAYV